MNYSVIIFCYNEGKTIRLVTTQVFEWLNTVGGDFEIIIVDDGSTDKTAEVCRQLKREFPRLSVIHHPQNLGIGMALRSGYASATKEYVCAIPGDGQFDVNELKLVQPFGTDTYYAFYRPQTNYNWYRKLLTWANRLFNQHLLGVYLRDVNWIKVYRREHLEFTQPKLKSSLIESEICAKLYKMGIMPTEIPSTYLPRKTGMAKGGSWKTLRKAIAETFKLWLTVTTFKPPK